MKRTQNSRSTRATDRRGATMVEFIVVVPVFFVLLFAGIEFATIGTIRSTSHNAAYEGARLLVIPGATAQTGIDEARRIMAVVGVDTLTVTTTPAVIRDDTTQITVDIEIPYAQNAVFTPWFVGNRMLRSTCTLKTERYEGLTP